MAIMRELMATLDRVQEATLQGDLTVLQGLSQELGETLQALQRGDARGLRATELATVRDKAARAAALLGAALKGTRAAQRRVRELREAAAGHRTYGPAGDRPVVYPQPMTLKIRV
jgi:hypothetical protein